MASEEIKGFAITPARVGFFLSLVAVLSLFWTIASGVADARSTLAEHQRYIDEDKATSKEIFNELKALTRKVDEVAFTVKAIEAQSKQASR
jgi:hypothetical protein